MIGKKIELLMPSDLEDCLAMLSRYSSDCAPLAGGTDLVVLLKAGLGKNIKYLLDISHIPELKCFFLSLPEVFPTIELPIEGEASRLFRELRRSHAPRGKEKDARARLTIGSMHTHSAIADSQSLQGLHCLVSGARFIGSPQIRNMGTLGGNLANASPAADLYPPLIVLGASATLVSQRGKREIKVEALPKAPGSTVMEPDEILASVTFEIPSEPFYSSFIKIGLRNSLAISVASGALFATFENGKFKSVRIACGSVAPTPVRMKEVESLLLGETPSRELASEAGSIASKECDPISDIRASRKYRRHVTGVIVSKLVSDAAQKGGRLFLEA